MSSNNSSLIPLRHSAEHVLTQAMVNLYGPDSFYMAMGPATPEGFYFDFEPLNGLKISEDDFPALEAEMAKIVKSALPITREEISLDEAKKMFASNPYKMEWLNSIEGRGEVISIYKTGESFVDLCAGPHVATTGDIKAFKLLSIAGAYWHGDEKNKMLTRIYGTAFNSQEELEQYLLMLEEAKKRDHRKLGKDLNIYFYDDEIGQGLPLWLPNGGVVIEELEKLAKETEDKDGYLRVKTPHITKENLFIKSGHLPYYAESMYPPMEVDGEKYYLKPMNCPFHHKIFGHTPRSYRDLPLKLAEYGTCYRYEKSGELFGLMRVRSMQMNDAHIYCTEAQFEKTFMDVIKMYLYYFEVFGVEKYIMRFSTYSKDGLGKKYIDNEALWIKTENMVRQCLTNGKVNFIEVANEAAFYGPKIDVQIYSAIGKEFTLATNQVDFAVPSRFDLHYTNAEGQPETPLCIHRAPLSTHERMIGFLLEHFGGNFPLWLSPVQVSLIPITDAQHDYALKLKAQLEEKGIRVNVDLRPEKMQGKIRDAQLQKVPYMLIIGGREVENNQVSVRQRDGQDLGAMPVTTFIDTIGKQITSKSLSLIK
ncbi:MAG: threonine--tRNA ligase [Candidatus Shapirobacteria bacterium]